MAAPTIPAPATTTRKGSAAAPRAIPLAGLEATASCRKERRHIRARLAHQASPSTRSITHVMRAGNLEPITTYRAE